MMRTHFFLFVQFLGLRTSFGFTGPLPYLQDLQHVIASTASSLPTTVSAASPDQLLAGLSLPTSTSLTLQDVPELVQRAFGVVPSLRNQRIDPEALSQEFVSLIAAQPLLLGAFGLFTFGAVFLAFINAPQDFSEAPFEPGTNTYSPKASDEFYSKRPLMVLRRILKLALLSGAFNTGLLFDWLVLGKLFKDEEYKALKKAEPRRAKEALVLCNQLGPTFIKLGQALSIRTDLIPELYALELRQLQDAVPPFDSEQAKEILRREFGVRDLGEIFSSLSDKPVASASIGQVYKGTLVENGKEVAVKVQRPGILAEIALDLYVLRLLTPIQTTLQNLVNGIQTTQDDIDIAISLVDEWGRGFVAETDYRLEALNTETFERAMRQRGLDAVCAPTVVNELVRDKVLVTEWVQGTRLDSDQSPDVPRLCGVAINAYLTMLLDTGVLHCDPHPGNILRTTDGKLCILDWGMTLAVPNDLQYALLEFIAHINVEDYDAIPQDFINLGFSPEGVTPERLQNSGITEGLSFAFRQLSAGGGPKKIQERVKAEFQERYGSDLSDEELQKAARGEMLQRMEEQLASEGVDVKGVTNVMEEMSRRNRELFKLPPYVLYVARAFSTLEGIGLSIDEDYAIVQECYPYLSRRLFVDRSPRAKAALKAMLGIAETEEFNEGARSTSSGSSALSMVQKGANMSSNKKPTGLSPGKLIEMSEGFASYTAATADVDRDGKGQAEAVKEFTKLFLDPEGSTLQDILVDETAKLGDAVVRRALRSALVENPAAKFASNALRAPKEFLNDERGEAVANFVPQPIKTILESQAAIPELVESLVATTDEDERVIQTAEELRNAIAPRLAGTPQEDAGRVTESDGPGLRSGLSNFLADGAAGLPQIGGSTGANSLVTEQLTSLATDRDAQKQLTDQLPGATSLGRRIGAGLLRRAAYRTNKTALIPENARRILVDANNAAANAIDPSPKEK